MNTSKETDRPAGITTGIEASIAEKTVERGVYSSILKKTCFASYLFQILISEHDEKLSKED